MRRVAFCCLIDLVMTMWLIASSALAMSYDDSCDVDRHDSDRVVLCPLCIDPVATTAAATAAME